MPTFPSPPRLFSSTRNGTVPKSGESPAEYVLHANGVWAPPGLADTRDIFSVASAGADLTGESDATAAIQSAITAARANVTATGRKSIVYFPAGVYACNSKLGTRQFDLDGASNLMFMGAPGRSKILMNGDAGASDWYLFHLRGGATDVEFRHLAFDQSAMTNPDAAEQNHIVQVGTNASQIRFYDCEFRGTVGDGVRLLGGAGAFVDGVRVERCRFYDCGRSGVSVQRYVRGLFFADNYCEGGTDQQIDFEPTGYTFTADSGGDSTTLVRAASTFVTNGVQPGDPIFSNTDDHLAYVVSVDSETQLTTTPVKTTWSSAGFYFPLFCANHTIVNNVFKRSSGTDILVTLTGGWNVTFERNYVEGTIQAVDLMRSRISGNMIRPRRTNGVDQVGVHLLKSSIDVDVEDNDIYMRATDVSLSRYGILVTHQNGRYPHSVTASRNTIRLDAYGSTILFVGPRRCRADGNRLVLNTPGVTNQSVGVKLDTYQRDTQSATFEGNEIFAIDGRWEYGIEFNSRESGFAVDRFSVIGGSIRNASVGVMVRLSGTGTFHRPPVYQGVLNAADTEITLPTTHPWVVIGGADVGARVFRGTGTPEGVLTAPVGSIAIRTDGSGGTATYVKTSGTGNTGWAPVGGVAATGSITCVAKANLVDGETITIGDGFRPPVVYELDVAGDGVAGDSVQVDVSGATTAAEVAAIMKTAIEANQPLLTVTDNTDGTLALAHQLAGVVGNVTITYTVDDAGFAVAGMSGGINPAR